MQLQGLMMMLFFTIVIPLIIMSANHNVFFILIAFILFIVSIRNSINLISLIKEFKGNSSNAYSEEEAEEKEVIEELEDMTNINMKKFSTGISFVKSLILILFFVYCAIYLKSIYLKIVDASLILFWVRETIQLASKKDSSNEASFSPKLQYIVSFIVDIVTIVIIITVAYNKYFNYFI